MGGAHDGSPRAMRPARGSDNDPVPAARPALAGPGRAPQNDEEPPEGGSSLRSNGGDLLSQGRESQVPSALRGLTALFGMGRGVSPSLWPPKSCETARSPKGPPAPGGLENCTLAKKGRVKDQRQDLDPLVPVC